jgi:hypothetical protein
MGVNVVIDERFDALFRGLTLYITCVLSFSLHARLRNPTFRSLGSRKRTHTRLTGAFTSNLLLSPTVSASS